MPAPRYCKPSSAAGRLHGLISMLNLSQRQTLQQKLTPQQVQYLQLLQLPVLALEQRIKAELEMNPLLEEADELEPVQEAEESKIEEQGDTPEAERTTES